MSNKSTIIAELNKLELGSVGQKVKFYVKDIGCFVIKDNEVLASDEDRDCTLIASINTFKGLLRGNLNPTSIYMNGELKIKGDISIAMQLGKYLANSNRN